MKSDISIIIPFLNEEENMYDLCDLINKYAAGKLFSLEILFVDDGSTDKSADIINQFVFSTIRVKIIKLSKNFGSHAALRAGISRATGEYCMFFSADLQEPVELIGLLFEKITNGYDLVGV